MSRQASPNVLVEVAELQGIAMSDRKYAKRTPGSVRFAATMSALLIAGTLGNAGMPTAEAAPARERMAHQGRAARSAATAERRYAIEFRARYALSYGHVFVMYGPLTPKGEFAERTVAGLHPAGESSTPWMIGHVLPVTAETGPSDGDLDDRYTSARFRIEMSRAEYDSVVAYIKDLQARSKTWHVLFNNCIGFVSDIGRYMGLDAPKDTVLYPKEFIEKMNAMNEGRDRSEAPSRRNAGS